MVLNISTFSISRPSKINPNWYFWYANKLYGNPGCKDGREQMFRQEGLFLCNNFSIEKLKLNGIEDFGIFMAIWFILRSFGIFYVLWAYFSRLGMLYQKIWQPCIPT
jgi:hypothetical protein